MDPKIDAVWLSREQDDDQNFVLTGLSAVIEHAQGVTAKVDFWITDCERNLQVSTHFTPVVPRGQQLVQIAPFNIVGSEFKALSNTKPWFVYAGVRGSNDDIPRWSNGFVYTPDGPDSHLDENGNVKVVNGEPHIGSRSIVQIKKDSVVKAGQQIAALRERSSGYAAFSDKLHDLSERLRDDRGWEAWMADQVTLCAYEAARVSVESEAEALCVEAQRRETERLVARLEGKGKARPRGQGQDRRLKTAGAVA